MRKLVKPLIKRLFLIVVFPLFALFRFFSLITDTDKVFSSFSQAISLIPGKIGIFTRAAFYSLACPNTSDDVSIGFLTILSHQDTTIRQGAYIGPQCNIGSCEIGAMTLIGSGVHILSGNKQHFFDDAKTPIQQQGGKFIKVTIGQDSWIGNGSIVMNDIGDKTIVAAGSLVTKALPPMCIAAGHPASIVRNR